MLASPGIFHFQRTSGILSNLRFSIRRRVESDVVGPVAQHVGILGIAEGLRVILVVVDEEAPGVPRVLGAPLRKCGHLWHRVVDAIRACFKEKYGVALSSEVCSAKSLC